MVPFKLDGTTSDVNNGMLLPDLTHLGATLVADFTIGLTSEEQGRLNTSSKSPLFALAESSWYSEYGELSTTRFASLDDEKKAYEKWGWSWTDSQLPKEPHDPDYAVSWKGVHGDMEADDLWQNFLMYLRTGQRGYWDRARGWANYFKWKYPFRTDGFAYNWKGSWQTSGIERPEISIPLTPTDEFHLSHTVKSGKVDARSRSACHLFGWGLIDYYYLTGDRDAIDAAIDILESSESIWKTRIPGQEGVTGYMRKTARPLLLATRVYEVTQDSHWKDFMEHMAQLHLQSPDWDDRGFYYNPRKLGGTNETREKSFSSYHHAILSHAFDRYHRLTGNAEARRRIIKIAEFASQYGLDPVYQYAGYKIYMDYPNPGEVTHSSFEDGADGKSWDPYTAAWIDSFARAFRFTGDGAFLERAKYFWDRASRTKMDNFVVTWSAGDGEAGIFVNYKLRDHYYASNGLLSYVHLLFYDVVNSDVKNDTMPPSPPEGLSIK
jgi:hypothetical protein